MAARIEEKYPIIRARAKRERALIFFADEPGIRRDYLAGTTRAPRGRTPVVKANGTRPSLMMLSAVNGRGPFRVMTVEGRVNAEVFRDFPGRLIEGVDRRVFRIADGRSVPQAEPTRLHE